VSAFLHIGFLIFLWICLNILFLLVKILAKI
jgi:hypothetical protein